MAVEDGTMVALHREDVRRAKGGRTSPQQRVENKEQARSAAPRLVRADALPEHVRYRDTGCELSPSCLRCPLARCKYDEPVGAYRMSLARRDREIALLRRRHRAPIDMLADTYGISRRSVFRILKEQGR